MVRRIVAGLVVGGLVVGGPVVGGPVVGGPVGGAAAARADVPPPPDVDGAGSGERPDARALALPPSSTVGELRFTSSERLAPGVVARTFETSGVGGPVLGNLLDVDLRSPGVRVGLLRPPKVAARRTIPSMADAQRALAGVNGDFFNISETRPGVVPTGSSSGPEVDAGRPLKGAVPDGQRFGPALPPGASAEDVIGIGADRRARLGRLPLTGTVRSKRTAIDLRGLNQYALPVGSAGAFTHDWGSVSRLRAVCGTDAARNDPCSTNTAEVTVRRGVVTGVRDEIGAGAIPRDTTVLVGREKGADALRELRPGDRVKVDYRFTGPRRFRFAVGGFPILRDGELLDGVSPRGPEPRTAAGVSRDGRRMYLVVADGRSERSGGVTLSELASLLGKAGADDAVNLDGGGSSTFVARKRGEESVTVRNKPSDGTERAVANGIGVFAGARRP
ncbi:phosphodiester glycosidase family protein [Actinomadura sp. KC345]|uniref:phosphodiester glycosidase family protein n=1 Tax=Actinomadura sp. KC345 TaxID=2530371 RepID=UPI001043B996|nr:phosphodiester glycosidase family protein [Actinomadura sp. KC345]TDC42671.1 phosphodiester glycosidase family protein [Actinomadura sp. KC345]